MSKVEILKLFPETVLKYKLDNFEEYNKELSKYIYQLYENDSEGVLKSNKGGWHSQNFKLNDKNSIQFKFAIEIQKYILKTFQALGWKTENQNIRVKEIWAIINKKNDFNVKWLLFFFINFKIIKIQSIRLLKTIILWEQFLRPL